MLRAAMAATSMHLPHMVVCARMPRVVLPGGADSPASTCLATDRQTARCWNASSSALHRYRHQRMIALLCNNSSAQPRFPLAKACRTAILLAFNASRPGSASRISAGRASSVADGTPDLSDDLARAATRPGPGPRPGTHRAHRGRPLSARNRVGSSELPGLIHAVHASLATAGAAAPARRAQRPGPRRAARALGVSRLHHLPRERPQVQDHAPPPHGGVRPHPRAVSQALGPAPRLPHDRAQLRPQPLRRRKGHRPRATARPRHQSARQRDPRADPRAGSGIEEHTLTKL